MAYNSVGAPANDKNLEVWEEELTRWNHAIDLLEEAISLANRLVSGRNLVDDLNSADNTARRLAGQVALKVERLRREQNAES